MSSIFNNRRRSGFTLIELLVVIAIIAILAAILFPVFAKARAKARQASGASNQKQIALAFLQYIQDYDEKFPPTYGYNGSTGLYSEWGVDYTFTSAGTSVTSQGLVGPYVKSTALFVDPSGPRPSSGHTICDYVFNDLLAGKSQAAAAAVASTVLTADSDGSDPLATFGSTGNAAPSTWYTNAGGKSVLAAGHAIGSAVDTQSGSLTVDGSSAAADDIVSSTALTRQSDGANFSFADGHVKWYKIVLNTDGSTNQSIYFPAQSNSSTSANTAYEPVPGGDMKGYAGTFHLN
jgi:prepilin-type N-terminal cleavage/methylation domain-containing protein/prepilin-type processing-associated H-X9-DG protein